MRRPRPPSLLPAALLALSACGGGFYVEWGNGIDDLGPPSVSLVASPSTVQAGQTVLLAAAASDENGIDEVTFYRLDGSSAVLLGGDSHSPYEWSLSAPTDGRSTLRVFARATDNTGHWADSSVLTLTVTP